MSRSAPAHLVTTHRARCHGWPFRSGFIAHWKALWGSPAGARVFADAHPSSGTSHTHLPSKSFVMLTIVWLCFFYVVHTQNLPEIRTAIARDLFVSSVSYPSRCIKRFQRSRIVILWPTPPNVRHILCDVDFIDHPIPLVAFPPIGEIPWPCVGQDIQIVVCQCI